MQHNSITPQTCKELNRALEAIEKQNYGIAKEILSDLHAWLLRVEASPNIIVHHVDLFSNER